MGGGKDYTVELQNEFSKIISIKRAELYSLSV